MVDRALNELSLVDAIDEPTPAPAACDVGEQGVRVFTCYSLCTLVQARFIYFSCWWQSSFVASVWTPVWPPSLSWDMLLQWYGVTCQPYYNPYDVYTTSGDMELMIYLR